MNSDQKKKRRLLIPVLIIAALFAAAAVYVSIYYHADSTAAAALLSDDAVTVSETDYGWFFDGTGTEYGMIFYPGAKVEETAYAPLLRLLAGEGMDVCLVSVPFRLAVLSPEKASAAMKQHDYAHWYIGGHSMGGAIASGFAADHADQFDGLVLCAAYPIKDLDDDLLEILITGAEDRVLNRASAEKSARHNSARIVDHRIQGGNHAGFGNYGSQKGDGTATITSREQQEETVRVIMESINGG